MENEKFVTIEQHLKLIGLVETLLDKQTEFANLTNQSIGNVIDVQRTMLNSMKQLASGMLEMSKLPKV